MFFKLCTPIAHYPGYGYIHVDTNSVAGAGTGTGATCAYLPGTCVSCYKTSILYLGCLWVLWDLHTCTRKICKCKIVFCRVHTLCISPCTTRARTSELCVRWHSCPYPEYTRTRDTIPRGAGMLFFKYPSAGTSMGTPFVYVPRTYVSCVTLPYPYLWRMYVL